MKNLTEQLNDLEKTISKHEILNTSVSKSNVGWHIEHTLLTINRVIEALKKSNPNHYKWRFKLPRILVFVLNKIPRGRATSPKIVTPINYDLDSLRAHLTLAKSNVENLKVIPSNHYFNHPYFGNLKLDKTIKFLELHTNHHLEIIHDILKHTLEN